MCGADFHTKDDNCKIVWRKERNFVTFMDLERSYGRGDRNNVGGQLLTICMRWFQQLTVWMVMLSCCTELKMGLKQGYVLSPWLFSMFMDGVMREVKARTMGRGGGCCKS